MNLHRSAEEVHREAKRHTRKRKKRQISMSGLEAKLDRILSDYIRRKDADEGGTVRCVTCRKLFFWRDVDCGHYVKRQHRAVRFDERNLGTQCRKCNRFAGGVQDEFAQHIIETHGVEVLNELMRLKHSVAKFSREELQSMCNHYTQKLSELDHART